MRILLYQGKSVISRIIRWQTRSRYSHAAIELDSRQIIEAWHVGGVRLLESVYEGHTPRTVVDCFEVDGDYDGDAVEGWLLRQVGQKYDFTAIARFMSRRDHPTNGKWFCSELTAEAFKIGGLELLRRIPPSHISPRDLSLSPLLRYVESKTTE